MNVLITGTTSGLGLELSKKFVQSGHRVFGISRSATAITSDSLYTHYQGDIASRTVVDEIARSIALPIDIVVNNAGLPGSGTRLLDVDNEEVQKLLNVHLFGALNVCRSFLEHLKAGQFKRITNISSRFGSLSFNQEPDNKELQISYSYRISKAAQNMLSVCMGNELDALDISVDVIHPGTFIGGCGRQEATMAASEVASTIYNFSIDEKTKSQTTLREIGKEDFEW